MLDKDAIETIQAGHKVPTFHELKDSENGPIVARFAAVPNAEGFELESLKRFVDEGRLKPERRKGSLTAYDLESFVAMTKRFKAENSVMFATDNFSDTSFNCALKSVLNFDPAGGDNKVADNGDHVVGYSFPVSEDLKAWLSKNKTPFNAKEFSEFLEEHIADLSVAKPDSMIPAFGGESPVFATPSKIFELSRGIEVRVDEKVSNFFRNNDGSFNLQYTVENKDAAGNALKLPEWFCLNLPIFDGGAFYQLPVRLRFRVKEGNVTWSFEMYRKNDVFRHAFADACDEATKSTDLPLFNGSPAR